MSPVNFSSALIEKEYTKHKEYFLPIARTKFPDGFAILKEVQKVPMNDGSGEIGYKVQYSDAAIILLDYLEAQYAGKNPDLRDAVFLRILLDIMHNGY